MSQTLRARIDDLLRKVDEDSPLTVYGQLAKDVPKEANLEWLREEIQPGKRPGGLDSDTQNLLVLYSFLQANPIQLRTQKDRDIINSIYNWIAAVILPKASRIQPNNDLEDGPQKGDELKTFRQFRILASVGFAVLAKLDVDVPLTLHPNDSVVKSIASYTDRRDLWTNDFCFTQATLLLSRTINDGSEKLTLVLERILRDGIRPLFAKKHPSLTLQARKVTNSLPPKHDFFADDRQLKPWKLEDLFAPTLYSWAVIHLNVHLVEAYWHLIIPPLLTILDDDEPKWKTKGCELMIDILRLTPPALLQRTGLRDVLEDATLPCLTYLPSLTPEDESVTLLTAAFPALISLARSSLPGTGFPDPKQRLFDKIMRQGIFQGYFHCTEHVKVVQLLVEQAGHLIDSMGIVSTKHLKDLLPILADILANPFGFAHPPLLIAAAATLQTAVLTNWPHIIAYRGEILRGICSCWSNVNRELPSSDLDTVRYALQTVEKLLRTAIGDSAPFEVECELLIQSDGMLRNLLT